MQPSDVAAHTERGIDLPKVIHEQHQTGEGGCHSGVWLTIQASHFLLKMMAEAMKCPWPAQSRKPELQSNGPWSFVATWGNMALVSSR